MAKKKPSSKRRKQLPIKDLASPAGGTDKVKGGALLLSTQQSQVFGPEGNGQPPERLRT